MSKRELVELGSLMASRNGSITPSRSPDEVFDLYSIPAFDRGASEFVSGSEIGSPKQVIQEGDVLLSKIVPHIRRAWIVGPNRGKRLVGSGEWIVFRAPTLHGPYLRYFLQSDSFHAQFMNTVAGVGGSLLRARPAFVAKLHIPLPPMAEQRRVAEILDQANALRTKRREALSRLDELAQSVFVDMFGNPIVNRLAWPRVPLSDLLEKIESGQSPVCLDRPAIGDQWGVLKLGAVTSCEYLPDKNKALPPGVAPASRHEVKEGDLLFSRKNTFELVAACALVESTPPRLLMPDLIFRLRAKPHVNRRYLHALLTNPAKRKQVQVLASGSAGSMPNISKARLLGLEVELPPHSLQLTFAARVEAINSSRNEQRSSLVQLKSLFESLQYRAFRGEL